MKGLLVVPLWRILVPEQAQPGALVVLASSEGT